VEARQAIEILAEPVEERLANAIGRRTKPRRVGKSHEPAAPRPGDDADAVAAGGASHGGHGSTDHTVKYLRSSRGRLQAVPCFPSSRRKTHPPKRPRA